MPYSAEFIAAWGAEIERMKRLQEAGDPAGFGLPAARRAPDSHVAPVRFGGATPPPDTKPWEGSVSRKPWHYRVTAAIVHLDTPGPLAAVIDTLRSQTERPYLLVIDAGSLPAVREVLRRWDRASDDLELIELNPKAWWMTSEPVAVGMDCAFARCQTEFLYATHTDVYLKRPDYLSFLAARCGPLTPAVGYQMSPRSHVWYDDGWSRMLSHTASLYHMPSMRRHKVSWSMTATFERYGIPPGQPPAGRNPAFPVHPDTEVNVGLCLWDAGVGVRWLGDPDPGPDDPPSVLMIGTETNEAYETEWLEHVRSTTGHRLYDPAGVRVNADRLARAVPAAHARAAAWRAARADHQAALAANVDLHRRVARCPHWSRGSAACGCDTCALGRGRAGRVNLDDCRACPLLPGPCPD